MKFKLLFTALLSVFLITGCSTDDDTPLDNEQPSTENSSKDEESDDQQPTEEARYYVKYEWEMPSNITMEKIISFTTEDNIESFKTTGELWEGTYGPFKKGVTIVFSCTSLDDYKYAQTNNHARIYVSRNQEPFVIKAEDSGKHDISLSYTIDF